MIDKTEAERILRHEAKAAERDEGNPAWVSDITRLSDLCDKEQARTHIAFIGVALLAKSVDAKADLRWIKPSLAKNKPNGFSARTLAEQVLVPVAAEFGIHLGVTSPQPLNNQPYFRMNYLGDDTPMSAGGARVFPFVLQLVEKLNKINEGDARLALRAFISVRRKRQPRYTAASPGSELSPSALRVAIEAFLVDGSEGGKRAQACVAGLFDAAYGAEQISSGRINDPSRNRPGDVCVMDGSEVVRAIEVKDKPVSMTDVQIFGKKAVDMGVRDAAYVMVASDQTELDGKALRSWASGFGLHLRLFYNWTVLVRESLFWSSASIPVVGKVAAERIRERLIAVECRPKSVELWDALTSGKKRPGQV